MIFDDYAKNWDTDKRINRAKIIANKIAGVVEANQGYTAMEFGCGTGLVSFNLYDMFKKITLIDSSEGMIQVLNSKIDKYNVTNMDAKFLDIFHENSVEEKFDVIYNSMALHHIQNTSAIVKRFYELLNNEGYLCIVDLDEEDGSFHKEEIDFEGHNGFNHEELKKILIDAGFHKVEIETFFYDEKIIKGEKIKYSLFLVVARKL